jgi:hypothetical protein
MPLSGTVTGNQVLPGALITVSGSSYFQPSINGAYRPYGYAMEIVNNTAPLYQQGTCTVWRQPMPPPSDATTFSVNSTLGTGAFFGSLTGLLCPEPPATVAEALLLNGSRQWHAKEGAMIVSTTNMDTNPPILGQHIVPIYYPDSSLDSSVVYTTPQASANTGTPVTNTIIFPRHFVSGYNMSGAFFTGLSQQTSLTINVRVFLEIFPSQLGNSLTALAQPSAPYDPIALKIISECMKEMPPGVMLCENGFGDWLSDVVGKIGSFISPIASTVARAANAVVAGVNHYEQSSNTVPSSATLRDDGVATQRPAPLPRVRVRGALARAAPPMSARALAAQARIAALGAARRARR